MDNNSQAQGGRVGRAGGVPNYRNNIPHPYRRAVPAPGPRGLEGGHSGVPEGVGRRGTNQLRLLERYLDVLVKHTTEIPPPTALVEDVLLG